MLFAIPLIIDVGAVSEEFQMEWVELQCNVKSKKKYAKCNGLNF